jgi:hypothetical protein
VQRVTRVALVEDDLVAAEAATTQAAGQVSKRLLAGVGEERTPLKALERKTVVQCDPSLPSGGAHRRLPTMKVE